MATEHMTTETVGDPPCDHDAYTPCPPECRDAKNEWRRRAAAAIVREQNAPLPSKQETLEQRVRESGDLFARLEDCRRRIGKMCSELRSPRMSIPVEWTDDDFFISVTIKDAIETLTRAAQNASAGETETPQAPIAKVIVREDGPADVMLYAPGLPPGTHDLYCEPPSPGGQKVPHPCFAPETEALRVDSDGLRIDELMEIAIRAESYPDPTASPEAADAFSKFHDTFSPAKCVALTSELHELKCASEKTNDGLPPFYTERKCSQCGATEERIQRDGCPEKCGRTAGDVSPPHEHLWSGAGPEAYCIGCRITRAEVPRTPAHD
jgi:hypothetical protein